MSTYSKSEIKCDPAVADMIYEKSDLMRLCPSM